MKVRWSGQIVSTAHMKKANRRGVRDPVLCTHGLPMREQQATNILSKLRKQSLNSRQILKISLKNHCIVTQILFGPPRRK